MGPPMGPRKSPGVPALLTGFHGVSLNFGEWSWPCGGRRSVFFSYQSYSVLGVDVIPRSI